MRTHHLTLFALGALLAACGGDDEAGRRAGVGPGADGGAGGSGGSGGSTSGPPIPPPTGLWVRSFEGAGDEGVAAVRSRPDGSFLVLGAYTGPATFNPGEPDETVLGDPDGEQETVLLHYEPGGSLRSSRVDPLGTGRGSIHLAADGGLYVGGTGAFAAGSLSVPADADVFVARYAPDGTPLWARSASGESGTAAAGRLATWPDGSVVIGGTFEGTITFGVDTPNETRLASTGEEIFLARYDADGALLWAKRTIAATYMPEWRLAATAGGGIALYGALENATTFNPGLGDEARLTGGNVGFLVQLDGEGSVKWARALSQDTGMNGVSSLAAFPDGSAVVTGSFDRILTLGPGEPGETELAAVGSDFPGRTQFPDCFVARFDAEGKLVWARKEGGGVWDSGNYVEPLPDGAALLTGSYTNEVTFAAGERAATTLSTPVNEQTAFVSVVEPDGALRWVRKGVSGHAAALSDGSIAMAGTFQGTVTLFPGEVGEKTLASAGGWDAYVVRFGWESGAP